MAVATRSHSIDAGEEPVEAPMITFEPNQAWVLNDEERDVFIAALLNPPEPNESLKETFRRFKESARPE